MKSILVWAILCALVFLLSGIFVISQEAALHERFGDSLSAIMHSRPTNLLVFFPTQDNTPLIGDPNAPLLFVSYLDPTSKTTATFFDEYYPQLHEDFIATKKIRYIPKFSITSRDYQLKTERFIYAQTLFCIHALDPERIKKI